jgi:hypothetical protein
LIELLAVTPIGRVPALVTDDGAVITDSTTICEYSTLSVPAHAHGGRSFRGDSACGAPAGDRFDLGDITLASAHGLTAFAAAGHEAVRV